MAINVGAPTLHARLLGGFAVLSPGEDCDETPWERFDTTSQVLKVVLLQPRLRCHPSVIVDALWPDVDADKARGSGCGRGHGRASSRSALTRAPADPCGLAAE